MDALLDKDDERAVTIQTQLWSAPRGTLSVHALVPQMGRGVPEPQMMRRSSKVAEEVAAQMKKICPAARPAREEAEEEKSDGIDQQKWLLQILLLEPEVAAASLTRCITSAQTLPCSWTWPNWSLPAGLAKVDIDQVMPSSAYRKLLESFWYMGDRPPVNGPHVPPVVDLGACPGGWTGALRLMGCRVLSVDRSPLDDNLMNDELVEFVEGDAFNFFPPWVEEYSATSDAPPDNSWMVSDVIAYPERVVELLEDWCGKRWVSRVVITCKFQGKKVPWDELRRAETAAKGHGYACKTKHFFNNKNEVTLMAIDEKCTSEAVKDPLMGMPMYPAAMIGGKIVKSKKK
jgi:23S rRNA C2498 (ribose-2'-O)-methylase RlmM